MKLLESKNQLWERCSQVCYIITLGMCTLFSISSVHFWSCLCIFSTILYQRSTFKMPTGYDKKRGRERTVKKKWNVDSNALSPRKYVTVLIYWILKRLLIITPLILIWIENNLHNKTKYKLQKIDKRNWSNTNTKEIVIL